MTVRAITNDELAKLRGEKQYSEVYAIQRVPNVIYTAELNGLPNSGKTFRNDMVLQISYTNGSGTLSNVLPDMTIRVGTSPGASDLGICRVRKTPISGTFYIGELSHIEWADGCHLTVVDDYDVLPRHLKIVNGNFLIDGDISYSDQHTAFEPVVNMGGHVVLEFSGEPVSIQRNASASWVFGSTISSYAWTAPGSSSSSGMTSATPTITYDAPGHYAIYCVVTAANGKTYRGVRYVFVVDPDDLAPIHSMRVTEDLEGTRFEMEMSQGAALTDFEERAFVILFARDYYGGVRESIGNKAGEENVIACGRIMEQGIQWNDEAGLVALNVAGWQHWLEKIPVFPYGLEMARNTPDEWTSMPALNVDRAIFHLLRYRSTVTRICDFHRSNDTRYAEELASVASNLKAQIDDIAVSSVFGYLIFDRFGSARLKIEPQLTGISSRSGWAVVQEITSADWRDELEAELNLTEDLGQVSTSGVQVSLNGSAFPRFSLAPGHIPYPYGNVDGLERLLLGSQSNSNAFAGLWLGWNNRLFDSLPVPFVGNNRMFSVSEYCYASIEITAGSNPRGIEYSGKLIPRMIEYAWDADSGLMEATVSFEDESNEDMSTDGDPPEDSGIEPFPPFPPPPSIIVPPVLPPFIIPPDVPNENHPTKVIIYTDQGVFWTDKFNKDGGEVEWYAMNGGLDDNERTQIGGMVVTPSGAIYIMTYGGIGGLGWERIMRASSLGDFWTPVFEATEEHADAFISGLGVNRLGNDSVAVIAGRNYVSFGTLDTSHIWIGEGGSFSQGDLCQLKFNFYVKGVEFWRGGWYVLGHRPSGIGGSSAETRIWRYTPSGTLDLIGNEGEPWSLGPTSNVGNIGAQAAGDRLLAFGGGTGGYTIIDDEEALSQTHVTSGITITGLAMSPVGTHGISVADDFGPPLYKTTDGAGSWQTLTGTIPVGSDVVENCRDNYRWIFGGGMTLRLTVNHGAFYYEKIGNLLYIAPLVDIRGIRYIE